MTNTTETVFHVLQRLVHGDPALQARLFALDDPDEFVAAVRHLAHSHGCALDAGELLQAMRDGNRAWFERKLP